MITMDTANKDVNRVFAAVSETSTVTPPVPFFIANIASLQPLVNDRVLGVASRLAMKHL